MAELHFVQVEKDKDVYFKLLNGLLVPYFAELEVNESCKTSEDEISNMTLGMMNMQGPTDRHLELVYDGDTLIGFHYCKVDHEGHKGFIKPEYGYIMESYVKPEHRRKGHGRRIFEREETLFNSHGTKRMYLNADAVSGLPFWKAMGFEGTGEIQPHNQMEIMEKEVR